jgi:L-iditol 2-dehydrogenase
MRALIFEGPNCLTLREWPVPKPEPGGLVIRVGAGTICGTDVRIVAGRKTRDVRRGHPLGHEAAGVVAAVGDGVTRYKPGDRVAIHPVVSCGRCRWCEAGHENLCVERITLGYQTDGCFADYMPIPKRAVDRGNVFPAPEGLSFAAASLLEPVGCCINGQHEMGLRGEHSVLIFGAGPIGLFHMLLAREKGCERVVVVEPQADRRARAATLGASEVAAPDEFEAADAFDAVILAVGVPELVNRALVAANKCGRVNLFAGFAQPSTASIDPNLVHYKQLVVTGASESRRRDYAEAMDLVARGRLDLTPIVTHTFDLADYDQAFRTAGTAEALKVSFV